MWERNSWKLSGRLSSAEGRRKPKSTSVCLRRTSPKVHAADLGDRLVRFVDDHQEVVREVVEQRPRRAAGGAAGEVARVVLDAGAVALLAQALDVVAGALDEALSLEQLAAFLEDRVGLGELSLDVGDRGLDLVVRGHEVLGREDVDGLHLAQHLAGQRVELHDALDLFAEEVDADGQLFVGREDRDAVAADAEAAADEVLVVALVLHVDEAPQCAGTVGLLADLEVEHEVVVLGRLAETVDAGHGGHDDHVAVLEEGARGGVAELVDLLVDVGVLGDVGVRARDVGFRLVIIVVRDEVLDGVFGEEVAELGVELGGERLVRRDDERGLVGAGDDVGHGERLAGARDAEQRLVLEALLHAALQGIDGAGLVAGKPEVRR